VRANVCALAIRSLPRDLAPRFGFRHARPPIHARIAARWPGVIVYPWSLNSA
jgi:hypothetical protein